MLTNEIKENREAQSSENLALTTVRSVGLSNLLVTPELG